MHSFLKLLLGASVALSLAACDKWNSSLSEASGSMDTPAPAPSPSSPSSPSPGNSSESDEGPVTATEGSRVLKLASGRKMAVDYGKGSLPVTWVLIHGLADDMRKMEKLSEFASKAGYPTLRMDLQGHGRTLAEHMKTHKELPKALDYKDNLEDIQELLAMYRISDVVLVGHSYGGGVAYALAAELKKAGKVKVRSLHMLAPYVQRIDKFLRDQYLNPFNLPVPGNDSLDETNDSIMDPILQQFMEKVYRQYILENDFKERSGPLTVQQEKEISARVQAAILATKGIRSLDLLDSKIPLPEIGTPLQILGGESDTLVLPRQLKAFRERLEKEKVPSEMDFMPGGTHLFPREMAEETFKNLMKFIEKN